MPKYRLNQRAVKAEFTIIVQPDGGIRQVEGQEKLLKEIAFASPGTSSLMKLILSDEALKKSFAPFGAYLPTAAVAPGATWTRNDPLDLGPIGRYVTAFNFTYHAAVGSAHEIRFKSSLKYTPPSKDAGGLPFVIKSAELTGEPGEGKIVFDAEKGRLRESSHTMRLVGTLLIEVGRQETYVDLEQTQTSRVRTMDTYVRPEKK